MILKEFYKINLHQRFKIRIIFITVFNKNDNLNHYYNKNHKKNKIKKLRMILAT